MSTAKRLWEAIHIHTSPALARLTSTHPDRIIRCPK